MPEENDIQRLLRLKRYEQPPPEYFDSFLREFHRRQRMEMLRQPLWRIALDRISAFFSEHSLPRYAYTTASTAVVVAGLLAAYGVVTSERRPENVATADPRSGSFTQAATKSPIALGENARLTTFIEPPVRTPVRTAGTARPRYVIDARPVSYEPAYDF